jgi:hypothetical protein
MAKTAPSAVLVSLLSPAMMLGRQIVRKQKGTLPHCSSYGRELEECVGVHRRKSRRSVSGWTISCSGAGRVRP